MVRHLPVVRMSTSVGRVAETMASGVVDCPFASMHALHVCSVELESTRNVKFMFFL